MSEACPTGAEALNVNEDDIPPLVEGLDRCASEHDLAVLFEKIAQDFGFECFAMVHHVDLAARPPRSIFLTNYPTDWIARSLGERYYLDDPVHMASTANSRAFSWSELPRLLQLTKRQQRILAEAGDHGLRDGFSLGVHVPGEYRASCSFGRAHVATLEPAALGGLEMLTRRAFDKARALIRRRPSTNADRLPDNGGRFHYPDLRLTSGLTDTLQRIERRFGRRLFSMPAWTMLMYLYSADRHRPVSLTSLSTVSHLPARSAYRLIDELVSRDLLVRVPDAADRRVVNVTLSPNVTLWIDDMFARPGA